MKLQNIRLKRDSFVIDATLEVRPAEQVLLIGPSGSGKTSLVRALLGFENPSFGKVSIDGQEVTSLAPGQRKIGAMLQGADFLEELSALDNVALALKFRGASWASARKSATVWLDRFGLSARGGAEIEKLSGGERSRLAWARVFVAEHRALVFDEPLTGVDESWAKIFRDCLTERVREAKIPALICAHSPLGWSDATRAYELVQSDFRLLREFTL